MKYIAFNYTDQIIKKREIDITRIVLRETLGDHMQ